MDFPDNLPILKVPYMSVYRILQRARFLSVAVFAALTVLAIAVPVRAEEVPPAVRAAQAQAKRTTTSFGNASAATVVPAAPGAHVGSASSFLYFPSTQSGVNIGGRLPVGKSHVYVPYYGTISNDPTHPGVQGATGLAYGFRTWDISLLNGGFGTQPAPVPGADQPKVNPSLSLSIHF